MHVFACVYIYVRVFVEYAFACLKGGGVLVGLLVDLQFNIRSAIVSSSLGKLDGSIYCIHYILEA